MSTRSRAGPRGMRGGERLGHLGRPGHPGQVRIPLGQRGGRRARRAPGGSRTPAPAAPGCAAARRPARPRRARSAGSATSATAPGRRARSARPARSARRCCAPDPRPAAARPRRPERGHLAAVEAAHPHRPSVAPRLPGHQRFPRPPDFPADGFSRRIPRRRIPADRDPHRVGGTVAAVTTAPRPDTASGTGLATVAADGTVLDTWYPAPALGGEAADLPPSWPRWSAPTRPAG